jgi:hypothetical protein
MTTAPAPLPPPPPKPVRALTDAAIERLRAEQAALQSDARP